MASLISRLPAAWRSLFPSTKATAQRGFHAAQGGRLFADWYTQATSSDAEIRGSLRKLMDRSRDLERNNDYQRGFLMAGERNIIGSVRYDLRMDCGEYVFSKKKPPEWVKDDPASTIIESAWNEWGKRGTCTICKRYSWRDVKKLAVRSTMRDGNFIARKVYGTSARNRFGFALQVFEIDHLDLDRFGRAANGNDVRFGIESDASGQVVAFWLRVKHPGDFNGGGGLLPLRVSATEIYHLFVSERAEQSIGIPWIVSAITRLRQLGMFEEAAVVAARIGAAKTGFFKKTPGPNGEIGQWAGSTNAEGHAVMEAAPGQFEELPDGWDVASWSPEYPNIETGEFRKAMLRGVATSIGMSYNTIGNDLEAVSFASSRVGLFEEREGWKTLQVFFTEGLWEPVFSDWLQASMLAGAVPLPVEKLAKFNRPMFKARRWPFIDPLKEVEAAKTMIALRLSSRRQFIEEAGGDVGDVFHDNLDDENLADDLGLSLSPDDPQPTQNISIVDNGTGDDTTNITKKGAVKAPPRELVTAESIAREVVRQTPASSIPSPAPNITIHNQPPAVTVNTPAVNVSAPEIRNEVNIPKQDAPSVTVNVPAQERQETPIINVNVPQAAAPVVNVSIPKLDATLKIDRGSDGKMNGGKIS